jgi:hypothetical protein
MFWSFVRVLLQLLGYLVLSAAAAVAIHLAITSGLLGSDINVWYGVAQLKLWVWFENTVVIAKAASPVVGVIATVVSGTWAIHKAFYFANGNMPKRIKEFLEKKNERLIQALPRSLERLGPPFSQEAAITSRNGLDTVLRSVGFWNRDDAKHSLSKQLEELDKNFEAHKALGRNLVVEKTNAHILLGATAAANAETVKSGAGSDGGAYRQLEQAAMKHFRAATEVDKQSLFAHEALASQLMRSSDPTAGECLERLRELAGEQQQLIHVARAIRWQAELCERRGTVKKLEEAQNLLTDAVNFLNQVTVPTDDLILEKARVWEADGRVREGRRTKTTVDAYTNAKTLYAQLDTDFARKKVEFLNEKLRQLSKRSSVEPEPEASSTQ